MAETIWKQNNKNTCVFALSHIAIKIEFWIKLASEGNTIQLICGCTFLFRRFVKKHLVLKKYFLLKKRAKVPVDLNNVDPDKFAVFIQTYKYSTKKYIF